MGRKEKLWLTGAFFILLLGVGGLYAIHTPESSYAVSSLRDARRLLETRSTPYRIERVDITPNATYSVLMEEAGVARAEADAIFSATQLVYDLSNIRVGRTLDLYFNKESGELEKLVYQIDSEEELIVEKTRGPSSGAPEDGPPYIATRTAIDYEIKVRKVQGVLQTSLYEWALANQIDERAIIEFANALQWSIDFANDPQIGDKFAFIFEERYRDGDYIMPGTVLAGKYVNVKPEVQTENGLKNDNADMSARRAEPRTEGHQPGNSFWPSGARVDKKHLAFYFEENENNKGYFDAQGNSLQKMFLRAPVAYKYISSGFTTGLRYVQAFNVSTGHRAIDYAAAYGTPVQSVGNGTVLRAGWNGSYGNFISVRHNGTYTTNYAHLSRIAVRAGQKVSQGQVIGYVGSTGFSTGPHLHYEMEKHGVKIHPLREVLPPGKPIAQENRERFFKRIEKYLGELQK